MPVREIKDPVKITRYKLIFTSVKAFGLIEPLMVFPKKDAPGKYQILDGHLRWLALRELGQTAAECIIARDDEGFTYNARVSRLTPIQEHRMIVKAVNHGVPPERVAAALNLPLHVVRAYLNLLVDIHPEVVELLKDKNVCAKTLKCLRQVSGLRQIEIAEFMVGTGNYAYGFAQALVLGSDPEQVVKTTPAKKHKGLSREGIAKMEQEIQVLERDFKSVEKSYGQNFLHLTLARAYVRKLLTHPAVAEFLRGQFPDIFSEFEAIANVEAL